MQPSLQDAAGMVAVADQLLGVPPGRSYRSADSTFRGWLPST